MSTIAPVRTRAPVHCGLCGVVGHNLTKCRDARILGKYRQLIECATIGDVIRELLYRPDDDVERDVNFILANFKVPTQKWKWTTRDKMDAVLHIYREIKLNRSGNPYSEYIIQVLRDAVVPYPYLQQKVLQNLQEMIAERNLAEATPEGEEDRRIRIEILNLRIANDAIRKRREEQERIHEQAQRVADAQRIAAQCATKRTELLEEMTTELDNIVNTDIREAFLVRIPRIVEKQIRVYKEKLENDLKIRRDAIKNGWDFKDFLITEDNCPICFDMMENINCVMLECKHQLCFNCLPKIQKCHMCRAPVSQKKTVNVEFGVNA